MVHPKPTAVDPVLAGEACGPAGRCANAFISSGFGDLQLLKDGARVLWGPKPGPAWCCLRTGAHVRASVEGRCQALPVRRLWLPRGLFLAVWTPKVLLLVGVSVCSFIQCPISCSCPGVWALASGSPPSFLGDRCPSSAFPVPLCGAWGPPVGGGLWRSSGTWEGAHTRLSMHLCSHLD